jgi:hypothetical protein
MKKKFRDASWTYLEIIKFYYLKYLELLWEPVKLNDGSLDGFGGLLNAYALGWPIMARQNHSAVASIGGGRAAFIIYPKDNLTIILFSNLTGIFPEEIIEKIARIYLSDIGN